jgi:hypothetical protein
VQAISSFSYDSDPQEAVIGIPFQLSQEESSGEKGRKSPTVSSKPIEVQGAAMVEVEHQEEHDFSCAVVDPAIFRISDDLTAHFISFAKTFQLKHLDKRAKTLVTTPKSTAMAQEKLKRIQEQPYTPKWLLCAHLFCQY